MKMQAGPVMLDVQQTGQSGVDNQMLLNMRRLHTVSRESLMAGGACCLRLWGGRGGKDHILHSGSGPKAHELWYKQ